MGSMVILLGAGLAGFLLHSCIDFAFFEPGVGTLFFVLVGTLAAYGADATGKPARAVRTRTIWVAAVGAVVAAAGWWVLAVRPVAVSQKHLQAAERWALAGGIEPAREHLRRAWQVNRFDPDIPGFRARLEMSCWLGRDEEGEESIKVLDDLERTVFRPWLATDPASFKPPAQLADFYRQAAARYRHDPPQQRRLREKALDYYRQALQRHPYKSELLIGYAELLVEEGGHDAEAREALRKALASEQAFLAQQRQMHPERPVRHRLSAAWRVRAERLQERFDSRETGAQK